MNETTLCYLFRDNKVLLGMKKRGFGVGRWNGYGGKKAEGETIEEATIREVMEETSVKLDKGELTKVGILDFFFPFAPQGKVLDQQVHVFISTKWEGDPAETEEMKPQWFETGKIPISQMWADDPHWLPHVIAGKKVRGEFTFGKDNSSVLNHHVKVTEFL